MRSPRFLWCLRQRALLFDPGGACAPMTLGRFGAAFTRATVSASTTTFLSGLNHTARLLAVYASPSWSPTLDARLASGWWSAFAERLELLRQAPQEGFSAF